MVRFNVRRNGGTTMYEKFTVKNFRGFSELTLQNIRRVNLITGKNNVGKSALLEALFMSAAYKPELGMSVNALRGFADFIIDSSSSASPIWSNLFFNRDTSCEIVLDSKLNDENRTIRIRHLKDVDELAQASRYIQERISKEPQGSDVAVLSPTSAQILSLNFERNIEPKLGQYFLIADKTGIRVEPITPEPRFHTNMLTARYRNLNEDAQRFSQLTRAGKLDDLINALRILEPRLTNLLLLVEGNSTYIHGHLQGVAMPLPLLLMGDGINRLASIILSMFSAANGVMLIDEIENGIHHAALTNVWKAIDSASRAFNTQVFATTHSYECIQAAHDAFSEANSDDLRVMRIDRLKDGMLRLANYDSEMLETALDSYFEIR
jgi:predicted ATPase